jgi:hypothetical protein
MNVVTKLSGGLGNQLFQYAAARRLAIVHGRPLVVDLHWYRQTPAGSTPRSVLLSELRIVDAFGDSGGDPVSLACRPTGFWARIAGPVKVIREKQTFRYDPRLAGVPAGRSLYLDGYWQSPRYFDDVRAQLLEEIQPRRELNRHYAGIARHIAETNAVMLHIRRGDYVHSATASSVHGTLPMAYYERSLAHLRDRERGFTVFVFSDDIAWARGNLRCDHPTVFVDSAPGEDAVIDELMLMSRCRHQIIANSSLSWWAAWLNRHEGKVVTAPQRWLASEAIDLRDLIPSRWALLPVD